jgi:hypothetical protein
MPTLITSRTASLIDHIYYYKGQHNADYIALKSGNLLEDISDHLPGFAAIMNERKHKSKARSTIRI